MVGIDPIAWDSVANKWNTTEAIVHYSFEQVWAIKSDGPFVYLF
jgi:hypothetical protein